MEQSEKDDAREKARREHHDTHSKYRQIGRHPMKTKI
jgi:hypothetical protein